MNIDKKLIIEQVKEYGKDIIFSETIKQEKNYIQHGKVSVYEHSFNVACMALYISRKYHIKTDEKTLVRGALLHDYFLYDWHIPDKSHRLHGFTHAKTALGNAMRDFKLNKIEMDIILKHMFPLNISFPRYRESIIVCLADKHCAIMEMKSDIKFKIDDKNLEMF